METVEETVQTETPVEKTEVPTGKAAFAAARQEIRARAQSSDQDATEPAKEKDDTSTTTTPTQEAETVAAESPETTPTEDALLTPEEVAKLSKEQRKQYESMNKAFTTKTQKLAAERKELEKLAGWKPLIDALENDPETALETLAAQRGLKLAKAEQEAPASVTTPATQALSELPEEWQFMKPIFDTLAKRVREETLAEVRGELAPIKEAHAQSVSNAVAAETNATLEQFTAKYPEWKKHEAAMLEVGKKIIPVQGEMSDFEYMEMLLANATAKDRQVEQTKRTIEKINKVVDNSEQVTQGVDSTRVEHVMPSGLNESSKRFRAAAAAARRGERWTARD